MAQGHGAVEKACQRNAASGFLAEATLTDQEMKRFLTFPRLSMIFLGVFGVMLAGIFVLQTVWVSPGERCEARGDWYDIETRTCATPIYIPDITGRPAGVTRAEASDAKNRELVQLEAQAAEQRRAVDAAVAQQRQELKAREGL